jgi:hypothetical protein
MSIAKGEQDKPFEKNIYFDLGAVLHAAILEPETLLPTILEREVDIEVGIEYAGIGGIVRAKCPDLFVDYQTEVALLDVELFGKKCKCKADLVTDHKIVDMKSCRDIKDVASQVKKWRYDLQANFYLLLAAQAGLPHTCFEFVFVMKTKPYNIARYCVGLDLKIVREIKTIVEAI